MNRLDSLIQELKDAMKRHCEPGDAIRLDTLKALELDPEEMLQELEEIDSNMYDLGFMSSDPVREVVLEIIFLLEEIY